MKALLLALWALSAAQCAALAQADQPVPGGPGEAACLEVAGERIQAADLARADASWAQSEPQFIVGLAPLPGASRWIPEPEMARWKKRAGIEAAPTGGLCVVRKGKPAAPEALEEAIRRSLNGLQHAGRQLGWTLVDYESRPLPEGKLALSSTPALAGAERPGGRLLVWPGRWEAAGSGRSTPFWLRLRIECHEAGIVLARDLPARALLEEKDLKVDPQASCEAGDASLGSLHVALGRRLRRSLPSGARLASYSLEPLYLVERGQTVRVEAQAAGAKVSIAGTAAASGSLGDRIPFRTSPKSRLLWGKVAGPSLITALGEAAP